MNIEKNKVVYMHYTLTDSDGDIIDSSEGQEPLPFIHGIGNIIPGLEKAIEGKSVGEKLSVVIPPEEGYGVINEEMTQEIPLASFPNAEEVELNAMFNLHTPEGHLQARVAKLSDEMVTLDFNHPLAGVTLHFDVEVVNIREATEEELEHGHVHDGGHHH